MRRIVNENKLKVCVIKTFLLSTPVVVACHSVEIAEFSVTQILREIKVGESRVSNYANTHLEAEPASHIFKIQRPKNGKNYKIDFTENMSDRKILKFPRVHRACSAYF